MAKKNSRQSTSVLILVLMFVAGFAAFSLIGFIILIIMLSVGILPAY